MADIVNLRRARKAKTRQLAEGVAEANRLKFGQSKAEKSQRRADEKQASQKLDHHLLDPKDRSR